MGRLLSSSLLLIMLLLLSSQVLALEIIYPADKTWFDKSNYLIIKGGWTPELEGIVVEMGGTRTDLIDISSSQYKDVFGDKLILQPDFDPGRNLVVVEGYVGGKKVSEAQADVFFRQDQESPVPAAYKEFVMHVPGREQKCAACHNVNPDPVELRMTGADNPCYSCHKRMLNKKFVHGPAGAFQCASCHVASADGQGRYQFKGDEQAVCNSCHADFIEKNRSNKFIHGPVEVGMCLVCHDAHASEYEAQLLQPTNQLCLGCHESVTKSIHVAQGIYQQGHPLDKVPDPTRPGKELSCASCHQPHGGMGPAYFVGGVTGRFALCQFCHQK